MTDEDRKPPIVLSRDELYSQIWTTPMIRLAAQYGITGTGREAPNWCSISETIALNIAP